MKMLFIGFLVLVSILLLLGGCQAIRGGYETAPYTILKKEAALEIREYPLLLLVETPSGNPGDKQDGSFMRLFGFITGKNAAKEKISMTTPVYMTTQGPQRSMAFVMPQKFTASRIPQPLDATLQVRQVEAGQFAVLRFSGRGTDSRERIALESLRNMMKGLELESSGEPIYGYFDPPWTPPFLRRNEVMLRLK